MKKTISVNLANRNFYIEEDAYYVLDQYIKGIREYYIADDPEGEIVEDFEMRLGEIFNDKMRMGHEVITLDLTKEAIAQLGRIEDLEAPEQESTNTQGEEGTSQVPPYTQAQQKESFTDKLNKKLYRDPINKWLGGVIAGLSVNLEVDVALLRLITVLLMFTPVNWIVAILYIIGWIILPEAESATDRLRMEGKPLNSANLWDTISKGNKNTSKSPTATRDTELDAKEKKAKSRKNLVWWIIAFVLLICIIATLIWGIVAISTGHGFYSGFPFYEDWDSIDDGSGIAWLVGLAFLLAFFGLILAILIIGGLIMLVYVWPISIILKSTSLSKASKWIIIILWILLTTFWIWL